MSDSISELHSALQRILREDELIYTVDGDDYRMTFEGEPPTAVHLRLDGELPGVALMVHAPLRFSVSLDAASKEWVLEASRNLRYGRVDLYPIQEDPAKANIVFYQSVVADDLVQDTVAFLLAVATVTSGELQREIGDRLGGDPVFD